METVPMLGNVDDDKHFSQLLEVAYCEAATELNDICHKFCYMVGEESWATVETRDLTERCEELNRLQFVMIATVQQTIKRRRRLANVTRGLADVVLDKEGSKE